MATAPPASEAPAEETEDRLCRYCFEGEAEGELVSPCRCSGGQKWVHLACLRRWQRGVLAALPTHPDLIAENRQRVCNICSSAFTIPPPTHMELLSLYTGQKVAELIAEGSLIGSHRGFTSLLRRQLAALPLALRAGVAHRHWIRGIFLIVRVVNTAIRTVRLRIDDGEDLQAFARRLEDGWAFEMHGRQLHVVRAGPLAGMEVPEDADASRIRQAVMSLATPMTLTLRSAMQPDDGEDGIIAVNLTRRISLQRPAYSHRCATFDAAVRTVLRQRAEEALLPRVCHFVGGPCDEDEAGCCIVVGGGDEPYSVYHGLISGLNEAQARATKLSLAPAGPAEEDASATRPSASPLPDASMAPDDGPTPAPAPVPPAVKRRRAGEDGRRAESGDATAETPATTEGKSELPSVSQSPEAGVGGSAGAKAAADGSEAEVGGSIGVEAATDGAEVGGSAGAEAAADGSEATVPTAEQDASAPSRDGRRCSAEECVRLLVFWGSAGWNRRQLLGETARGSWGLCRAEPGDVTESTPEGLWEAAYPRLAFAPPSEVSEDYVTAQAEGSAGEDEESTSEQSGWHRWLARHQLSLQRRARILGSVEEGRGNDFSSTSDEDSSSITAVRDGEPQPDEDAATSGNSGDEALAAPGTLL